MCSAALDKLSEGVGDQVIDVFEVIGSRRQRYFGLSGHRAVAYGTHAFTHDNTHGGIENGLAALFTALSAGFAALVLHALGDGVGHQGGAFLGRLGCHSKTILCRLFKITNDLVSKSQK